MQTNWQDMPVVRGRNGMPVTNNVRPINRTEIVRRIFAEQGLETKNASIHDMMAFEGLFISDSVIDSTRKKMRDKLLKKSA